MNVINSLHLGHACLGALWIGRGVAKGVWGLNPPPGLRKQNFSIQIGKDTVCIVKNENNMT